MCNCLVSHDVMYCAVLRGAVLYRVAWGCNARNNVLPPRPKLATGCSPQVVTTYINPKLHSTVRLVGDQRLKYEVHNGSVDDKNQ